MDKSGITRRMDELGRVVIPRSYRRTLGIESGDALEISALTSGEIVLKKASPFSGTEHTVRAALTAVTGEMKGRIGFYLASGEKLVGYGTRVLEAAVAVAAERAEREYRLGEEEVMLFPMISSRGDCVGVTAYFCELPPNAEEKRILRIVSRLIAEIECKF